MSRRFAGPWRGLAFLSRADLTKEFDSAFMVDRGSWKSARARAHWLEAEGWRDSIAGPLWSIVRDGGCEYVYPRQDSSFADVHDPASLRNRLFEWHARLVSNIGRFAPSTDAEVSDQLFMQSLVERIRVVIERAIEIESHRWQAIHTPVR